MDFVDGMVRAWECFRQNDFAQALDLGQALLDAHGERADTLNLVGACRFHSGDLAGAEQAYRSAIAADPGFGPAWTNLGNLLTTAGRRDEVHQAFREAAEREPGCVEAWNNLGLYAREDGRGEESVELLRRALAIDPDFIQALFNLGTVLVTLHRGAEAELPLRRLLELAPGFRDAEACLGAALVGQGRHEEGIDAYRRELARDPTNKMALNNLGLLMQERRHTDDALELLGRAAEAYPDDALSLSNYANVLRIVGRMEDAARYYQAAASADPSYTPAVSKCMLSARGVCDWTDLPEIEARICENLARNLGNVPAPFDLLVHPTPTGAQHHAIARAYANRLYGSPLMKPPLVTPGVIPGRDGEPLRIGYISADYLEHATMRLLGGVFDAHDPAQIAFICYSTGAYIGAQERARIERAPACAGFRDVARLSDEAAAELIRDDRIDLLIDLKGYTKEGRLGIQALRPAPIVVAWLGYPGTLGEPRLADYLIGDAIVSPLARQADFSETLALMPHCNQPNDDKLVPGPAPDRASQCLPDDGLVFCNFNASYKFSPAGFAMWMQLLREVAGSVLWLLDPGDAAWSRLVGAAAEAGIDPARLVRAPAWSQRDHLARLQLADIALDCFPCTSHTTGSDALLAGGSAGHAAGRDLRLARGGKPRHRGRPARAGRRRRCRRLPQDAGACPRRRAARSHAPPAAPGAAGEPAVRQCRLHLRSRTALPRDRAPGHGGRTPGVRTGPRAVIPRCSLGGAAAGFPTAARCPPPQLSLSAGRAGVGLRQSSAPSSTSAAG